MKRISPGTVTVAVVAILFGLIAAYAVRRHLSTPKLDGVEVVVARYNLPKYARIQASNIETTRLPAESVPEGAVRKTASALSRLVEMTVKAGEVITEKDLYELENEPVMAEQLPPGMKAVTISVAQDSALAGVLLPESLIDISLTVGTGGRGPQQQATEPITVTLVHAVRVLATSQQRHRFSEASPRPLRTITVATNSAQANKLILAQQYGRLNITLRSALEPATNGVGSFAAMDSGMDRITANELVGRQPKAQGVTAQIWRGTSVSDVTFLPGQVDEAQRASIVEQPQPRVVPASVGTNVLSRQDKRS